MAWKQVGSALPCGPRLLQPWSARDEVHKGPLSRADLEALGQTLEGERSGSMHQATTLSLTPALGCCPLNAKQAGWVWKLPPSPLGRPEEGGPGSPPGSGSETQASPELTATPAVNSHPNRKSAPESRSVVPGRAIIRGTRRGFPNLSEQGLGHKRPFPFVSE